jgi:hypothetical protein
MQSSQHVKHCIFACIAGILVPCTIAIFSGVAVPSAVASSRQADFITDSTPSLRGSPSQLNEKVCHTSNHQNWTCIVTLYGENIAGVIVIWTASTPISSISISPSKGNLVELVPDVRITISHIPCMNTSFLFSGQVYGGGGVIPTTILWSCRQKPTPTPAPAIHPSPTPKTEQLPATPVATRNALPTPTMTLLPTPGGISSSSQSDPLLKGTGNLLANIFLVAAVIVLSLEVFVLVVLLGVLIRRAILRMS